MTKKHGWRKREFHLQSELLRFQTCVYWRVMGGWGYSGFVILSSRLYILLCNSANSDHRPGIDSRIIINGSKLPDDIYLTYTQYSKHFFIVHLEPLQNRYSFPRTSAGPAYFAKFSILALFFDGTNQASTRISFACCLASLESPRIKT